MNIAKLQKILKRNVKYPMLNCINYNNGFMTASNNLVAFRVKTSITYDKELNINVFNGDIVDDKYPVRVNDLIDTILNMQGIFRNLCRTPYDISNLPNSDELVLRVDKRVFFKLNTIRETLDVLGYKLTDAINSGYCYLCEDTKTESKYFLFHTPISCKTAIILHVRGD